MTTASAFALDAHVEPLLADWSARLAASGTRVPTLVAQAERDRTGRRIVEQLAKALVEAPEAPMSGPSFAALRTTLGELSATFAERGLTPSETATYVFSLKEAVFGLLARHMSGQELVERSWALGSLLDALGLYTFEAFGQARERIVKSQARAITELSTPVIQVWEGILAMPLVGAIDSHRAKEIMEKLLEAVVAHEADIVILDITGVPVVDTQVANRLMRTVEGVRLLGTRSIITGINPVIAQTLVQLGVDLSQLTTKASLRAGLQLAFRDLGITVSRRAKAGA